MEHLEKFIILTLFFTLTSARTYFYEYHYPQRNNHWNVRYPQPPFSFEGGWPMGPLGFYPYPPATNEEYYPERENSYQQELLVQSLNKALTKLNMLLAPISNSNQQETTSFPPNTAPEVLAEALNKAIDRLGVLLASQQMSVNKEIVTEAQTEQAISTETVTERQKEQMVTVTEGQKEQTIVTIEPNKIYESANSAIDDLNKLFSSLPEELKPRPNQNNNNNVIKPIITNPLPVEPPFVSTIVSKTTAGPLFTSDVSNKVTPAPSVPNIVSNSGVSTEQNLFTSSEFDNTVINSSPLPSDVENSSNNNKVSESDTDVTTENLEIPINGVTIDNDGSTIAPFPDFDIRWKGKNETKGQIRQDIVFIDDDDDDVIDLSSRLKQTSTTQNPQLILTYKPSRPPFHADIFPPNPTVKPQTVNLQSQPTQNRPVVSNVVELADRFQTTTSTQNPQLILTYKPSRPPFHADVFPPNPTVKPQTNQNRPTEIVELVDRNQQTTTTQNPQLILTYKPSRPPFHADIFPPNPTVKPQANQNGPTGTNIVELVDRNQQTTTLTPPNSNENMFVNKFSPTTENIISTTKNSNPYYPTPYYSSPINLAYKPTRPFYAPNPVIYPSPGKPPGTPWPASSTERTN